MHKEIGTKYQLAYEMTGQIEFNEYLCFRHLNLCYHQFRISNTIYLDMVSKYEKRIFLTDTLKENNASTLILTDTEVGPI